jgi:hypothetical protein
MPRTLRLALVGLAVPALVLAAGSTARAERWSATDPAGDVIGVHHDPEPEPCGTDTELDASTHANDDITRLTVRHTRRVVEVTIAFRDLGPALAQSFDLDVRTQKARGWSVDVERFQRRPGQPFRVLSSFSREQKPPDPGEIGDCELSFTVSPFGHCGPRPAFDLDRDTVRVTLPRWCLRNPLWVRIGAGTSSGVGTGGLEHWTYDRFTDEWGARTAGADPWLHPLGPRVPAPRGAQKAAPSNLSRVTNSSTSLRRSFVTTLTGLPRGTRAATAN